MESIPNRQLQSSSEPELKTPRKQIYVIPVMNARKQAPSRMGCGQRELNSYDQRNTKQIYQSQMR